MLDHSDSNSSTRPERIFSSSSSPGEEKKKKERENFRRVSTGEPEGGQLRSHPLRGDNPIAGVLNRFILPPCVWRRLAAAVCLCACLQKRDKRACWNLIAGRVGELGPLDATRFSSSVSVRSTRPGGPRSGSERGRRGQLRQRHTCRETPGGEKKKRESDCRLTPGRLRCAYLEFNPDFRCPFPSPPLCV